MLNKNQLYRYSRQILLPEVGVAGQRKLLAAKVLIVGAGGLGSPAALYLAAAGVGTIGIADFDAVDLTNLQRQIIHSSPDIGRKKVESAAATIRDLNPDVTVLSHDVRVGADNILDLIAPYDFIIDGTDNFASKFLINDACVKAGKPYSHAGVSQFVGQTLTWAPGQEAPCYRCIFAQPPPPGSVPTCQEAGILGPVVGVLGTVQAVECLKYLLGTGELLLGRLLIFDFQVMETHQARFERRPDCAACGRPAGEVVLQDGVGTVCGGESGE
jgi:molybdopterin/thiamine biosynthesis adenylyltransferase